MKIVLSLTDTSGLGHFKYERFDEYFESYLNCDIITDQLKSKPKLVDLYSNDKWVRFIKTEIREWLETYGYEYSLFYENTREDRPYYIVWGIDIADDAASMLFKLTWG
jgi:hypothetical protein